ncbi:MAG: D-glycero-beta-D-manno-heptose 1-phosphate adenylyltransferase [Phycisphaerae bacterium]|nr:D-glycero-beta-D-manno-heptose 1-phosphate adenylyltransferase [Phycisphaerae bacterium]
MEKLIDKLESLGSPRILLAGDLMLDEYIYGDIERISPEAPVPVLRVVRREDRLGGTGNVGLALRALNANVDCVGVVGNDAMGQRATGLLKDAGISCDSLVTVDDRPTIVKTRFVGLAQHRHQQQVLRVDTEDVHALTAATTKQLQSLVIAKLKGASLLAIEDYGKGLVDDNTPKLIAAARKMGIPVVVDPHPNQDFTRYRGATLVTPNRYEAELATGIKITSDATAEKAAEAIIKNFGIDNVLITLDKEGCYVKQGSKPGAKIPTRPRTIYDVTGAGDVVMAMVSLGLAEDCDLELTAALANVAGGLEVERFGVVPVSREEIVDELRKMIGLRRSKVMPRDRLAAELQRRRRMGESVVFTNGCFDLLHMGHVAYLQQAREKGSLLVVAINSDDSIRKLKGPGRPIIPEDERAKMLAALEWIDYVTVFDEDTPEALLELLRPDILVKGGSTDVIVGQDFVESYGGVVERLDMVKGRSTTDIINKIVEGNGNG